MRDYRVQNIKLVVVVQSYTTLPLERDTSLVTSNSKTANYDLD